MATNKVGQQIFSSFSFVALLYPVSGIRDPGWIKIRIRDPGSAILCGGQVKNSFILPGYRTLPTVCVVLIML
jgi:hypothetical protein